MYHYPKPYLSVEQLVRKLIDLGMTIQSRSEAEETFNTIGYYRLIGYCRHRFDKSANRYIDGTNLNDILKLYYFDTELAHLLFEYISQIEIALRVRFVNAFQPNQDALALVDPSFFKDKALYWKNQSVVANEIARSNDIFIKHNYDNHDGAIPLWATVEIMSLGTLSKLIKNLNTGGNDVFSNLVRRYRYTNASGRQITPSRDMFTSWLQAVSVIRNICAHNSRVYNRAVNTTPQLISSDRIDPMPQYGGLYQIMLAMKYLRPTDRSWMTFAASFSTLLEKYTGIYDLSRMNFPEDWVSHFQV